MTTNKLLLIVLCCLGFSFFSKGQVVINEFSGDPGNNEGNGDFIELFNTGGATVDIGCWVVGSADNGGSVVIPAGTMLAAGQLFLIASSSNFSCATCDFPNVPIDLDTDGCSCLSNSSFNLDNDGEILFLMDDLGAFVELFVYGVPDDTTDVSVMNPAGCAATTVDSMTIVDGGITDIDPTDSFTDTGCSTSYGRETDGSATFVEDHSPTPGTTNNAASGGVGALVSNGVDPDINTPANSYDSLDHTTNNFVDNISVAASGTITVTIGVAIPNWVGIFPGGEPIAETDSIDRMEAVLGGGASAYPLTGLRTTPPSNVESAIFNGATFTWGFPVVTQDPITGITTVVQVITITGADGDEGLIPITLYTQENFTATGSECTYEYTLNLTITAPLLTFDALSDCDDTSGGTGTAANIDEMYVHISNIAAGDGVNPITFTNAGMTDVVVAGDGSVTTALLGPIDVTGLAGQSITITATQNGTPTTIEVPVVVCGYNNAVPGAFCTPDFGIISQASPDTTSAENTITSTYVYVLVDTTAAPDSIVAVNNTGLFLGLINNNVYTVHAFRVDDADLVAFEGQFTIGSGYTAPTGGECFASCGSATYLISCCSADAGDLIPPGDSSNLTTICAGVDLIAFDTSFLAVDEITPTAAVDYEFAYITADLAGNIIESNTTGDFDWTNATNYPVPGTYNVFTLAYNIVTNTPMSVTAYLAALAPNTIAQIQADDDDTSSGGAGTGAFCLDLNGNYTDGNQVAVMIVPQPDITTVDTTICDGNSVDLSTLVSGTTGTLTYYNTFADAQSFTNTLASSTVMPNTTTTYYVADTVSSGGGGTPPAADLIITAVFDGPLSGGTPKGIELYVVNDIADLSQYGVGSATNGGGTDGEELTLSGSATAGDYIYIATEAIEFMNFFGFAPDYTTGTGGTAAANINGDDAVELFFMGTVIDVFGDINVDGTGQPWEYLDGWASRVSDTGPDGSTFMIGNWTFSGPNALDGETTNAGAATPVPVGTFTFAQASAFICSDIDSIMVTVNPQPAITTTDTTICDGNSVDLSTLVSGTIANLTFYNTLADAQSRTNEIVMTVSPNTTTEYYIVDSTATNPTCTDLDSITVNVNPQPAITTTDSTICDGNSVDLSTLVSGTIANLTFYNTLADAQSRTNSIVMTVSPNTTTEYYVVDSTATNPTCTDLDSITITVNPQPAITASNTTICPGGTVDLTTLVSGAIGNLTFYNTLADAQAHTNELVSSMVTPGATTEYYVVDSTATTPTCTDLDSITVTVSAALAITTMDSAICNGGSIDLSTLVSGVSGNLTFYNTLADAQGRVNNIVMTVSPVVTTEYYVVDSTATNPTCTDLDSITITVNPLPAITTVDSTICDGSSVDLTGLVTGTIGTLTFYSSLADAQSFTNPIASTVMPSATTEYYVADTTGTMPVCSDIDSITITVNPLPAITTVDSTICDGSSVDLTGLVTGTLGTLTFYSSLADAQSFTNPIASTVMPNTTTEYYVADTTGTLPVCSDLDSITITVNPSPDITTVDSTICDGSSVDLTGLVSGTTGTLTFYSSLADAQSFTNTIASTVMPSATTTYYVADTIGTPVCSDIDSILVTVNPSPDITTVDSTICDGGSIDLTGLVSGTTGGLNFYNSLTDAQSLTNVIASTVMPGTTTTYYVTDTLNTGGSGMASADLIITAVYDGPLTGGAPKGIELYVVNDIADLSQYGVGSATNGGGTDGEELTLSGSATAGDYIYIATEAVEFMNFFGFAPDYTTGTGGTAAANINGDDAIELFFMGTVIDVFGDINVDGTGQPWEYLDGWASRVSDTGPDGSIFMIGNWTFSGPNALDGETTNAGAATPVPIGTFSFSQSASMICSDLDSMTITVNPAPAITTVDSVICNGSSVDLTTLVSGTTGTLTFYNTLLDAQGFTNTIGSTVTPGTTTTYYVADTTGTTPVCSDIDSITIIVNAQPAITTVDTTICDGASVTLSDFVSGTIGTLSFYNTLLDAQSFTNTIASTVMPSTTTTYYVADTVFGSNPALDLIITAVYDGTLSLGTPKGIELYVVNDIADLSLYGVGSANNGDGTDGEEYTLSGSATAGQYIYIASEATMFTSFFGFAPDYTNGALAVNGDDAIELFYNGSVIDVFGDINVDGSGQAWEYMDGWASRVSNTGPDGNTFVIGNWTFSGPNALDGEATNAGAATPVPIGTYTTTITSAVVCSDIDSILVTVNPQPDIATRDTAICLGNNADLSTLVSGTIGTLTYYNTLADAQTFTNPITSTVSPIVTTTFYVVDSTGTTPVCSDIDSILVTIETLPVVEAGNDITICSNENVDLTILGASITGSATTGTWTTSGDGTFDGGGAFGTAATYTPGTNDLVNGTVTLTLTSDSANSCGTDSDTVTIFINRVDCGSFPWNGE